MIRKTEVNIKNYIQFFHRIRLRAIKLTEPQDDIQEIDLANLEADPLRRTRNEPE